MSAVEDVLAARVTQLEAENAQLRKVAEQARQMEQDFQDAAGELAIPLPKAGTIEAKLLCANLLLRRKVDRLEPWAAQLEVQLAGCSVAALGYATGENLAKPGDYAFSASFADTLRCRVRMERLTAVIQSVAETLGRKGATPKDRKHANALNAVLGEVW